MTIFSTSDSIERIGKLTKSRTDEISDSIDILERKTDKKIEKIYKTVISVDEFKKYQKTTDPAVEWYNEYHIKIEFMYDIICNFYMNTALHPIIRVLNYFFHWYVLEICKMKYDANEFCVVIRPIIMNGDDHSHPYTTRSKLRKSFYKKHMKIFKNHYKKIKKLGYSLYQLPIKF